MDLDNRDSVVEGSSDDNIDMDRLRNKITNHLQKIEEDSLARCHKDDVIYQKLFEISLITESTIDQVEYLLSVATKTKSNVFNVNRFVPIDFEQPMNKSSIDSFKIMLFAIKKFVEKRHVKKDGHNAAEISKFIMKLRDYFTVTKDPMRPIVKKFILELLRLRRTVLKRFEMLGPFEYMRQQYLHSLSTKTKFAKRNIADMQKRLTRMMVEQQMSNEQRRRHIKYLVHQLKHLNADLSSTMHQMEIATHNISTNACVRSFHMTRALTRKNVHGSELFSNMHSRNLAHTRDKISVLFKRETLLSQVIARYDREILPRFFEQQETQKKREEVEKTFAKLAAVAHEQELAYDSKLNEKSFLFFNDTYYTHIRARSARTIQAWFRRYGMPKYRVMEEARRQAEALAAALAAAKAAKGRKGGKKGK